MHHNAQTRWLSHAFFTLLRGAIKCFFASLFLECAGFCLAPQPASAVTVAWSPVGNPGNANDPIRMSDGTSGYGAVDYNYRIGTYEVTVSQYVEFLNAKDATGANKLGLYDRVMGDAPNGGINFTADNPPGGKYSAISGRANYPANYVTWYSAIRFANWLNNGQGSGDTESGTYTLLGGGSTPSNDFLITRNAGATVFLPSEDEWYKAAYYNPDSGSYFLYPTSSNMAPKAETPPGGSNSANYYNYSMPPRGLSDVGAYTGTTSPYGAFDMGGNVAEWNEARVRIDSRGWRGGSYADVSLAMQSSLRPILGFPSGAYGPFGFRVASVPEPSSVLLAILACGITSWFTKRFK